MEKKGNPYGDRLAAIRKAGAGIGYTSSVGKKKLTKNPDKIRGSLIGGAAGDALGYAVEFLSEPYLFNKFGNRGITEYERKGGLARFSDDTQMTLFTANALLVGTTRGSIRGIMGSYRDFIATAYQEWFKTQNCDYPAAKKFLTCWLMNVRGMYAVRAPGNTCLSAIQDGCWGTPENPINDSKGCGGVMRVAPIGLYFGENRDALWVDLLAADAAALTHGHEMGYIPAAMLAHIVRLVSQNDEITLKEAVLDARAAMARLFAGAEHLDNFLRLMDKAVELSERKTLSLIAIHQLGEGWVGEEALAIAIYCALKFQDDFDKAICAAVNHGGDSDSTGAITGNILGAYLGLSKIPQKYLDKLELKDVILELADDLYHDCRIDECSDLTAPENAVWADKYVSVTYPKKAMMDIHMHLIPGVDDGAMDVNMALSMMNHARNQGIRGIFATPHSSAYENSPRQTKENFLLLRDQARKFLPDLELYSGCEVFCEENAMAQVLEALRSGAFPTMNGTNCVLAEFSQWVSPESAEFCVKALAENGWIPIVAHMERYAYLRENMALVDTLRAVGARIQVNAYSLQEEEDESIKNWARRLVTERRADFLGTDAHRTYHRPPSAAPGLKWLYENMDKDYADQLAWGNARRLLTDRK